MLANPNPLGGAGKRPFRLGANHRQVKSAHLPPGLRPAFGVLFHRRENRFTMDAVSAFGIHCVPPDGHVAVSKTDFPACATNAGLGGSAGSAPLTNASWGSLIPTLPHGNSR